ncbi:MAG TPA: hypothetical protein VGJ44_07200 [Kribbellaceae bacterium]|jgi:hypothetical protein
MSFYFHHELVAARRADLMLSAARHRIAAEARRARTTDRGRSTRLREVLSGWLELRRRTRVWRRDAAFQRALAAAGTPAARHELLAISGRQSREPATAPNEQAA